MIDGLGRFVRVTWSVLFVVLPVTAITLIFLNVARGGLVTDFENTFYVAARAVLDGENPYPALDDPVVSTGKAFVYPPVTAILATPLTVLDVKAAGFVVMALLVLAVLATLGVLGIRDWRCYALALLWPPVISAVQTGNVTILLGLAAALTWRFRERLSSGVALGLSLAVKLFLWPLLIWLVALRRVRAAAAGVGVGTAAIIGSWAAIGFDGIGGYPDLLRRLQDLEEADGYTLYALAADLGAPDLVARALWALVALGTLAGVVALVRRGDERRAFALSIAAALACSPIVWLHYFALLLVVVAVMQPRLGPAWFVPLLMYGSTGTHNGTTLQTALTIAAAALTVLVALGPVRLESVRLGAPARLERPT